MNLMTSIFAIWIMAFGANPAMAKAKKTQKKESKISIVRMIEQFSKKTDISFVVDPGVKGEVYLMADWGKNNKKDEIMLAEALVMNGYTWIEKEGFRVVRASRNAQRDGIPVFKGKLPPRFPQKLVTMVFKLEAHNADAINKELRLLTSKDGEMAIDSKSNTVILSDYTDNIHRVAEILKFVDK